MSRKSIVSALAVLIGASVCNAQVAPTPIMTLATIKESSLFSGLGLAFYSAASSATTHVYRPPKESLARQFALRVYFTPTGDVLARKRVASSQ